MGKIGSVWDYSWGNICVSGYIALALKIQDINSPRSHVRGLTWEHLEDWVSVGLQLGQCLCLALKIQDVNSTRLPVRGLTWEYLEDWVSLGLQLGQYLCLRLYCSWLIDTQLGFTAGRGSDHCF